MQTKDVFEKGREVVVCEGEREHLTVNCTDTQSFITTTLSYLLASTLWVLLLNFNWSVQILECSNFLSNNFNQQKEKFVYLLSIVLSLKIPWLGKILLSPSESNMWCLSVYLSIYSKDIINHWTDMVLLILRRWSDILWWETHSFTETILFIIISFIIFIYKDSYSSHIIINCFPRI